MAAPSKPFTTIADGDIDPESPLTVTLMTAYRDRDQNLKEWLGGSFTAAVDHDHDGTNSKLLVANTAGFLYLFHNLG